MFIVDFHTHTFPDRIAEKTVEKLSRLSRTHSFTDGSRAALLDSMKKAGIAYAVTLPVATRPDSIGHINDTVLATDGKDGIVAFGAVHPDAPDALSEIDRLAAAGVRGIKLHPVYQGVDLDDKRNLAILYRAGERGLCVTVHAGDDIGFPGVDRACPAMARRALEQVGPVRMILAHMGGWKRWDEAMQRLCDTACLLDTSFSLGAVVPRAGEEWTEEEKKLLSAEKFCALVRAFGAERILFGTDLPWTGQRAGAEAILSLPLTEEEKLRILGENARALLGL
ncbi:MAG: amidohydrolase family protein [Clostridia bacterium]|nr:amidohydrolase family protein [Clostridia bacterium]